MREILLKYLTYLALRTDQSSHKEQATKTLTTMTWLGRDGDLREILIHSCHHTQLWIRQTLTLTRHACMEWLEWPIPRMDGFREHSQCHLPMREPLARDVSIPLILLELKLVPRLRDLSLGWNEEMWDRLTKLMTLNGVDLTQLREHPQLRET